MIFKKGKNSVPSNPSHQKYSFTIISNQSNKVKNLQEYDNGWDDVYNHTFAMLLSSDVPETRKPTNISQTLVSFPQSTT